MKVYFIRPIGMRGPIKIGCSSSPDNRRSTLETWSPFPLEIIAEIEGDVKLERRFHAKFFGLWQSREWFRWSPELQATIDEVAAGTFDTSSLPDPRIRKKLIPGRKWTEQAKLRASYSHRIRRVWEKTNLHLRNEWGRWEQRFDEPEVRAALDAFLADPKTHGITREEWLKELHASEAAKSFASLQRAVANQAKAA